MTKDEKRTWKLWQVFLLVWSVMLTVINIASILEFLFGAKVVGFFIAPLVIAALATWLYYLWNSE